MSDQSSTPQEELLLIHVGIAAVGIVAASLGVWWLKGSQWLVAHGVLVDSSSEPLVAVPGAGGAGLDVARLAIVAAVVVAGCVVAVDAVRRSWRDGGGL